MSIRSNRIYTVLLFLAAASLNAAGESGFSVLERDANTVLLEWHAPDLSWKRISAGDRLYVLPDMSLEHGDRTPGAPQLPVDLFILEGDARSVVLLDSLATVEHCGPVLPAPTPGPDSSTVTYREGLPYASSGPFPERLFSVKSGRTGGRILTKLQLYPLRYEPQTQSVQRLHYARFRIRTARSLEPPLSPFAGSSRTAETGSAVKIRIVEQGIYGISGADLEQTGLDPFSLDPALLRLTHGGEEWPCTVSGAEDGRFDAGDRILFYADRRSGEEEYYHAASDTNVFWLHYGGAPGTRLNSGGEADGEPLRDWYFDTLHLEKDLTYHAGDTDLDIHETFEAPGEAWIWTFINRGARFSVTFDLADLSALADTIELRLRLRGTTLAPQTPDHHARIMVNEDFSHDLYFNDREQLTPRFRIPAAILRGSGNRLDILSVDDLDADRTQFYLDWIELDYRRSAVARPGWLHIEPDEVGGALLVSGFQDDEITVWDLERAHFSKATAGRTAIDHLRVESAGLLDGNRAKFYRDGELLYSGRRGINLVTLNPATGIAADSVTFDTFASTAEAESLAAFIGGLEPGFVVLAAIRDEATARLNESAYRALERLGSARIREVGSRESWALIGEVGAAAGSVPESYSGLNRGPAVAGASLTFPEGSATYSVRLPRAASDGERVIFESRGVARPPRLSLEKLGRARSPESGADYIIITHPLFRSAADQLAGYRASRDGFRCRVVEVDWIYDDFNHGLADPGAIKAFLAHAYAGWPEPRPAYLLLFGDASWDPKLNLADASYRSYVPSFGNPVSDTWFACFDGTADVLPEMNVGRLPVSNPQQASDAVEKIMAYESTPNAGWMKNFLFISGGFDRDEQAVFNEQSQRLARDFVQNAPVYGRVIKINKLSEGLEEGEHREEILAVLNEGTLWTNFIGHAGSRTWDLMFHNADIKDLTNGPRYPFISSMTCHTGRFAEPDQVSFGERFTLEPGAGAIAFWGTSGFGYSFEDYLYLQKLFKIVLQDSLRRIGDAITRSKLAMWSSYGSGSLLRNLILQYNLLGDPAVRLALPVLPDLALTPVDLELEPTFPSEADSTAELKVRVHNFGLVPDDSVTVSFRASASERSIDSSAVLPPVGLADSLTFPWSLRNMAGTVQLEVVLDEDDLIPEADEDNNRGRLEVSVLSSRIRRHSPPVSALLPPQNIVLRIQNPPPKLGQHYIFQIDTSDTFDSPLKAGSGPVPAEPLMTRWALPPLQPDLVYHWRAGGAGDGDPFSLFSFFHTAAGAGRGWRQSAGDPWSGGQLDRVEWTRRGASLQPLEYYLLVQSAGMLDGRYAVISINGRNALSAGRGYNFAVLDYRSGETLDTARFDTYGDAGAAAAMAQFLEMVGEGNIVLAAVNDEGASNMSETAYRALETLGSAMCRQIRFRDSWALIGVKGAETGSVAESYKPSGSGEAVLRDTLQYYPSSGWLVSDPVGPAGRWNRMEWQDSVPAGSAFKVHVLGLRTGGGADTLLSSAADAGPSGIDLSAVDAKTYPRLALAGQMKTSDGRITPQLRSWQVLYDPVPDPATGTEVLTLDQDTLLVGQPLLLSLQVHNLGEVRATDVGIRFQESDPIEGRKTFAQFTLPAALEPDSSAVLQQKWISRLPAGRHQIYITLDPENDLVEVDENNNSASASVYVTADTSAPRITLLFDGSEILNNDLVSMRPNIEIKIYDDSPRPLADTAEVQILLDGRRIPHDELVLLPSSEKGVNRLVRFKPQLSNGEHVVDVLVSDLSANRTTLTRHFRVFTDLRLLNVMNYPNPFERETDFTFELTQPAEIRIKLFTVAGRLIRVLDAGWRSSGFQRVHWDGCDEEGDQLANGVYLYKISARTPEASCEEISKVMRVR